MVVSPIPVKQLTPVTLTDPGHLTGIKIHAFVAGAVKPQVREKRNTNEYSLSYNGFFKN